MYLKSNKNYQRIHFSNDKFINGILEGGGGGGSMEGTLNWLDCT